MSAKYISIKQASEILGVSSLTLRNWDKKGLLTAARNPINNYRVYKMEDIEKFTESIDKRKPKKLEIRFIEGE